MKRIILPVLIAISTTFIKGQTNNTVLVEVFTETGCGACASNDSAFQVVAKANADKIAEIDYHCFYQLDTFYQFNKACDEKYKFYKLEGFPSAMINGKRPIKESGHISYVNSTLIEKEYAKPAQFKIEVACKSTGKGNVHSTSIKIKATALKDIESKDLRLYIAVTENNIDHEKRYHVKSVNGINEFNHVLRALLPDANGTLIGEQKTGKTNTVKATFTNIDKEIDFKEVRLVVFIQDPETKEVNGATVTTDQPFK